MTIPGWRILEWDRDPQQDVDDLMDRVLDHALWRLGSQYDLHQTGLLLDAVLADRLAMWRSGEPE